MSAVATGPRVATEYDGASLATSSESDRLTWDRDLAAMDGHLLQSWRWGEFKARHGWEVERVRARDGMAQMLFRRLGPVTLAYIPRGPAFVPDDAAFQHLLCDLDDTARRQRALQLTIELDQSAPLRGSFKAAGFVRGPHPAQPARTVKIPLLPDEELLAQMHQKTRYSVRLAERRGVTVRTAAATEDEVATFYGLLADTADRNDFSIHTEAYYLDFLRIFGDDATLLFAEYDGLVAAGLVAATFGAEAIYMYGASSSVHRAHGAAFLLQFEAMRWARRRGCASYDLWGIPLTDPVGPAGENGRVAGTKGDDWRGLHKFKTGFGGEIVSYPTTLQRRYRPLLSFVARRFVHHRG